MEGGDEIIGSSRSAWKGNGQQKYGRGRQEEPPRRNTMQEEAYSIFFPNIERRREAFQISSDVNLKIALVELPQSFVSPDART